MASAQQLTIELERARERTDELFGLLAADAIYDRPIAKRHRNIFYLGHLEAFDWNLIGRKTLDKAAFHPAFDKLFEFGIDPPDGRLPEDQPRDWPSVEEISLYNERARAEIDQAMKCGGVREDLWHVAIEHRLMHAETFAYMLHNLPAKRKHKPPDATVQTAGLTPDKQMTEVPAGFTVLGRQRGGGFGWDNEFDATVAAVPAFAVGRYKVTNGEYLDFVRAGADPPHFWLRDGDDWFQRTMFGMTPLPLTWPVYVTQAEAATYAKWKGKSLPTEAQFHRALDLAAERGGNYNFRSWDPIPVTCGPRDGASSISQLTGNGWEWTSTVFEPFPGFEPFPFYPGYSANFFDGDHYVLKGASARTAACFLRRSFRNWFRPDYPYVFAGFRCVEN